MRRYVAMPPPSPGETGPGSLIRKVRENSPQQRGDPDTEEQLDRVSGDGWVAAKDGDYADALAKGHTVILLVTESTGAFSADLDRVLRQLARTARASGSTLTTRRMAPPARVHPLALHLPLRGVWSVACVNTSHRPAHLSLTK